MMRNMGPVALIVLAHVINAQYETIWEDDMSSNSNDDWVCGGDNSCDFGYDSSSSNCPNSNSRCHRVIATSSTGSYIIRTTTISAYSALRFQFDVNSNNIENGEKCSLYIRYDGGSWTREWFVNTEKTKRYDVSVSLPDPSGASSIEISLEVEADGDPNSGSDRCYYDNALLEGIRIIPTSIPTSSPTPAPTSLPTTTPTHIPTTSPTHIPTKSPTYKPTEAPITPGSPTKAPSNPTKTPTSNPTKYPTLNPTKSPSLYPTIYPSLNPSKYPSLNPTKYPSSNPTYTPTNVPSTAAPSQQPTKSPVEATINSEIDNKEESFSVLDSNGIIFYVCVSIVSCLFLVMIILLVVYYKKRKRNKNNEKHNIDVELSRVTSVSTNLTSQEKVNNGEPGAVQLAAWLNNICLGEYYDIFASNGYCDDKNLMIALGETTNEDLKDMGIVKLAHRKLILNQVKKDQKKRENGEEKQNEKIRGVEENEQELEPVVEIEGANIINIKNNKTTGYYSDDDSKSSTSSHAALYKTNDVTPKVTPN